MTLRWQVQLALALVPFVPGTAQSLSETLKQGEQIFAGTCGSAYCHGVHGAGGGAPRLAARGFDQAYVNATVIRGLPGTSMAAFGTSLSRADLGAVVAYVAYLNGVSNILPLLSKTDLTFA